MSDSHFVLIHGLSSKPPKATLESRYEKYLSESVGNPISPERIHLAYWADLMGYEPDGPAQDEYTDGGVNFKPYSLREALGFGIRGFLRHQGVDLVEDKLRGALGANGDNQNMAAVLPAAIAGGPAGKIYERFVPDLNRYFFEGFRERVRDRLNEQLAAVPAGATVTLIAHSMGSIIAADLLLNSSRSVQTFVTIGSPLGIRVIKEQLGVTTERLEQMGGRIGEWFNLYDRMDVIALDSDLADDYAPIDVEDVRIRNEFVNKHGERNHHKPYGYLRCPEMGEIIG